MAKEIYLTQGQVAMVSDEDYDFINKFLWFAAKRGRTFYAYTKRRLPNGKRINLIMHRVLLNIEDPKVVIDHIDHNGLNNQRFNIRICTFKENSRNRLSNGKSKFNGVDWQKRRKLWRARISTDNGRLFLGDFDTEVEAALAYNKAAAEFHKEFASINIVDQCPPSTLNLGSDRTEKDSVQLGL